MTSFLPFSYRVFIEYCVFSEDFKLFRTLAFLCFPSVSVCVHTPAGRTPVLQQNLQSTEKSQNFLEKNTIIKEHPVCRRKKLYFFFVKAYPSLAILYGRCGQCCWKYWYTRTLTLGHSEGRNWFVDSGELMTTWPDHVFVKKILRWQLLNLSLQQLQPQQQLQRPKLQQQKLLQLRLRHLQLKVI